MEKTNTILIVEDEPIIAEDITGHLQQAGFYSIKTAHDLGEAVQFLETDEIDFVLIDVYLTENNEGIRLAKIINENYHIPFVYITSNADTKTVEEIRQTHPVGYVLKPFQGKEIIVAIEIGYSLFYAYISTDRTFDLEKAQHLFSTNLTAKEYDVLTKILAGKNNNQIGEELFVSLNTVKTHLKNIFVKAF